MTTFFISDLHLSPERPQIGKLFRDFLELDARRGDALYILGDLFEYWVGDDGVDATGHREAIDSLCQATAAGLPVFFMHGNRDFLVSDGFANQTGACILDDPTVIDLHGVRVLLSHGDRWCTDDVDHQRFRHMVDDPDWRNRFLAQPLAERIQLALVARSRSEQNKAMTAMDIMDVNEQTVAQAMAQHGVRHLIHGHTHRPAIHEFEPGLGPLGQRIVLGDWYHQSSVLRVDDDGSFVLSAAGDTFSGRLRPETEGHQGYQMS